MPSYVTLSGREDYKLIGDTDADDLNCNTRLRLHWARSYIGHFSRTGQRCGHQTCRHCHRSFGSGAALALGERWALALGEWWTLALGEWRALALGERWTLAMGQPVVMSSRDTNSLRRPVSAQQRSTP